MTYLQNRWYVAAWADEVAAGQALGRTILDEPLVLYREEAGNPVALADTCPHRFAPLSQGLVRDGSIVCKYHGLAFGPSGGCTANPHGPISRNAKVRAFPLIERHRLLWVWIGPLDFADPNLIPDFAFLDAAPDSAFNCGYLNIACHYELLVDNLLDLSHTDYLHPDTLGGGVISQTKPVVTATDDHVDVIWESPGAPPSPLMATVLPVGIKATDVWQEVRWFAPAAMRLISGATAAGGPKSEGFAVKNCHIITPETARTSHYFFGSTRNFRTDDLKLNEQMAQTRARIFATEDKPMLEQIQARMGDRDFWSMKPVILPVDAAPVLVRHTLQKLREAEHIAGEPNDRHPPN